MGNHLATRLTTALIAAVALLGVFAAGASASPYETPHFDAAGQNEDGSPSVTAGARPFKLLSNFDISRELTPTQPGAVPNNPVPTGNLKDIKVELPPGIVGNAAAYPKCSQELIDAQPAKCPINAQVGTAFLDLRWGGCCRNGWQTWALPVYNMVPPRGVAAQIAFRTLIAITRVNFYIRTGSDYGVTAVVQNSNTTAPVLGSRVTVWGVPGAPGHDSTRADVANNVGSGQPYPEPPPFTPFLSNPTSCDLPLLTTMSSTTWQDPGKQVSAPAFLAPKMTECNGVDFSPAVEAKPSTNQGDSPSGLEFNLHIPQHDSAAGEAAANEVQSLKVFANTGQMKLSFDGETTADLPFNATTFELRDALEALAGIGPGDVDVTGGPGNKTGSSPYKITFQNKLGRSDVEELVPEDGTEPLEILTSSGPGPGSVSVQTTTPGSSGFAISEVHSAMLRDSKVVLPPSLTINPSSANGRGACNLQQIGYLGKGVEKQTLTYDVDHTGSFQVEFKGQTTASIAANSDQDEVREVLETLPGLVGNITVQGAPGGFVVAFGGSLTGTDVPEMTGTVVDNSVQTVAVTGADGGFNLHFGGGDTAAHFEAGFPFTFLPFVETAKWTRPLNVGETLVNPTYLAPGTKITEIGFFTQLTQNPLATGNNVPVSTELAFDTPAATLQEALRMIPGLADENVIVESAGTSGDTRTYKVIFNRELAGTQPALLTATNSLTGPGAGVVITQDPPTAPHPLEVATTQKAGVDQFTPDAAACPDNSKLGTVRIDSPSVIDHPLEGSVYLATPHQNPFGSLLAMYIAVDDPETGVVVKLPGRIDADPKTGQLTAIVADAPQLPFEDLHLSFFKGATAPLRTSVVCGTSAVETDLTPWTAPEGAVMHPGDSFTINQGCAASEAAAPNTPRFEAGTADPTAGAYSPFVLKLSRADGTQQLTGIDTTLPKGLIARLAGVPYCSDAALAAAPTKDGKAEQANPSCGAASKVGTVTFGAGAGPAPYYAQGTAYLAGPYKGAPLSIAVITPAVAGPFDLGTVVVRNALYLDPETTQARAVSDPFPTILEGIPLDIRSVVVNLDRPQFTKNPTSCNPLAISGAAAMLTGQSAPLNQRFQVGDCGKLGFKPKLALSLSGGTKRAQFPALKAVLTARANDANISGTTVVLPKSELLEQAHIGTICTRPLYAANQCPARSVYGFAKAWSPLLDQPLEGPVYLRANGGARDLPDLAMSLDGQIHVDLIGFIDAVDARIRTRFVGVPDAPVSKFVLEMQGGKKGLLTNNRNICKSTNRATVQFDGHNGKTSDSTPVVTAKGCKGSGKKKSGKKKG